MLSRAAAPDASVRPSAIRRGVAHHRCDVPAARARTAPRRVALGGVLAAASLAWLAPAAPAAQAPLVNAQSKDVIADRYVVVLKGKPGTARAKVAAGARWIEPRSRGVRPDRTYTHALNGFAAQLTPDQLNALRADADVELVAADTTVRASDVQSSATWDLDRVDQVSLPLNNAYRYTSTGAGVKAYVIDSGIRTTHAQFGGRAVVRHRHVDGGDGRRLQRTRHARRRHDRRRRRTASPRRSSLVAVRVLDCSGIGSFADVIAGVDWVTAQPSARPPAVANMSLSGARVCRRSTPP